MLVLSRKKGEQIDGGEGAVILTVVEIRGDKVRIGIDAPRDVPVHRMEVAERMREEAKELEDAQAVDSSEESVEGESNGG